MRFLYSKTRTTYDTLLSAIKEAEIEWLESRGQARMKSANIIDRSDEIEELQKRLDQITATMKSSNFKGSKPKKEKNLLQDQDRIHPETRRKIFKRTYVDPLLQQQDSLNPTKAPFNATSVVDGGTVGGSVPEREM